MPKKKQKFTHKDVVKEWQKAVKDRALEQNVSEDDIVRYGLFYPFKKEKEEKEFQDKRIALLEEIRDAIKKGGK